MHLSNVEVALSLDDVSRWTYDPSDESISRVYIASSFEDGLCLVILISMVFLKESRFGKVIHSGRSVQVILGGTGSPNLTKEDFGIAKALDRTCQGK